jgi:uncharacterized protein YjbJ (UPF0337 family)
MGKETLKPVERARMLDKGLAILVVMVSGSKWRRARSMKSSRQDKIEGALDVVKGQVKKTAGSLTGDEGKKAEGRKDRVKGAAKWGRGRTKDILNK